jgi:hypothetical protein
MLDDLQFYEGGSSILSCETMSLDTEFFQLKPSRLNSQTGPARHGESNTGIGNKNGPFHPKKRNGPPRATQQATLCMNNASR